MINLYEWISLKYILTAGIFNMITVWMQTEVCMKINPKIVSYSELGNAVYGIKGKIWIGNKNSLIHW